ncbi:MAG: alpha/beta fold hydrolase [Candidatus Eutrophobiaceae bacterium]
MHEEFRDYPFKHKFFDCQGLQMHYVKEGEQNATRVLMLHGNPTWSYLFRHFILDLRTDFCCLAPDHIGMGLSAHPSLSQYPHTLARRVDDLDSFIAHECLTGKAFHIIAHDWGGMIALAWAVRHPERVASLFLMNTAAFPLPRGKSLPQALQWSRMPILGGLLVRGLNAFCRGALRTCMRERKLDAAERSAYLYPYSSWNHRLAVHHFVLDIPLGESSPSWQTVLRTAQGLSALQGVPMRLAWGMRDFVFDGEFLAEWIRRFPDADVHRFPNAGHFVMEDQRAETVYLAGQFIRAADGRVGA